MAAGIVEGVDVSEFGLTVDIGAAAGVGLKGVADGLKTVAFAFMLALVTISPGTSLLIFSTSTGLLLLLVVGAEDVAADSKDEAISDLASSLKVGEEDPDEEAEEEEDCTEEAEDVEVLSPSLLLLEASLFGIAKGGNELDRMRVCFFLVLPLLDFFSLSRTLDKLLCSPATVSLVTSPLCT